MSDAIADRLTAIAERARAVARAERSAVVLGEEANAAIHFVAATGPGAERLTGARGPAEGSGLCGNVLAGNCSILSKRTIGDARIHQGHARDMDISTALGVPVVHDGSPFAVLMALNRADGASFTEDDEGALTRFAEQIADELWELSAQT